MRFKKLLALFLIAATLVSCKKENTFSKDLEGTIWHISKITGLNGNNNFTGLNFLSSESFYFKEDGTLEYTDFNRKIFKGVWRVREEKIQDYCNTLADGTQDCTYSYVSTLSLEAETQPSTPQNKKAYFSPVKFTDAKNFKALLSTNGLATHEYSFAKLK